MAGTTTKISDARPHRRHRQLKARQGPMFPGNIVAQSARDETLHRVMEIIRLRQDKII